MFKSKSLLLATMLASVGLASSATEFTVDGIKYNVTDNNAKTVEVIANNYQYQYDITIPETITNNGTTWTVTAIGQGAFSRCNVYSVQIPNSVTSIGQYAFNSSAVMQITLPESLKEIESGTFKECTNLKTIELPKTLTSIGQAAFYGSGLLSVEVPNSVTIIEREAFCFCESLEKVKLPESLRVIPPLAFDNCHNLREINFPETLVEIGSKAFYRTKLSSVTIPENVTIINEYTFCNCSELKSVKLPSHLTEIHNRGFAATGITELSLPNTLLILDEWAFNACRQLRSVYIPDGLTSIPNYSFQACDSLKEFHIRSVKPLSITENAFGAGDVKTPISSASLFVPKGSLDAYKNADIWSEFANIIEEDISVYINDIPPLVTGSTATMELIKTPNVAYFNNAKWSSSNNNVATVDNNGVITAISEGTATIEFSATVKNDTYTAKRTITVIETPENYFIVNDLIGYNKQVITVPVSMINNKNITAFQCDIYLPDGLEIATVDDEYDITFAGRETRTHTISAEKQTNGSIRIAAYSSKNSAFTGNEGVLFNIPIFIDTETQDLNISIKDIILVDDSNNEILSPDLNWTMTIKALALGDANGDGKVTITDATTTVSYILGEIPETFLAIAADVTGDGNVTINDVTGIVNIVLGATTSATTASVKNVTISPMEVASIGDKIYINDFTISAGETKDVEICMANSAAYTAFQCDIYLPEGLNFLVEDDEYIVDLSSRKNRSHTIATNLQPDGALRVVAFSSKNSTFTGNDGALMILPIVASENLPGGTLEMSVKNNLFVSNNVEYEFDDVTAKINDVTMVDNVAVDSDFDIYTVGRTLYVNSPKATQLPLVAIDGRAIILEVEEGLNIYSIDNAGVYIINNQKIIIK